jgi:hypothetical protein
LLNLLNHGPSDETKWHVRIMERIAMALVW